MAHKVSVCIPTYNHAADVRRLLDSLVTQTFQDFAVFVSDDSDDDSVEKLVAGYADGALQHRITYHHNAVKLGFIHNWNAAIRMSDGDYIKVIFSDDFLTTPDALDAFAKMLDDHPEAALAFSGSRQATLTDDPAHPVASSYDRHADDAFADALTKDCFHLFFGDHIGAPSAVIYRRTDPVHLFDEKSGFASDVILYLRILTQNPHFAWTKDPLITIGLHEDQYTETFSEMDDRIYQDYRYMFLLYRLWKKPDYYDCFLNRWLIPFAKPLSEARACHIKDGDYLRARFRALKAAVRYKLTGKST